MSAMDTEADRVRAVIAQHLENVRRGVVVVCGFDKDGRDLGKGGEKDGNDND